MADEAHRRKYSLLHAAQLGLLLHLQTITLQIIGVKFSGIGIFKSCMRCFLFYIQYTFTFIPLQLLGILHWPRDRPRIQQ